MIYLLTLKANEVESPEKQARLKEAVDRYMRYESVDADEFPWKDYSSPGSFNSTTLRVYLQREIITKEQYDAFQRPRILFQRVR